MALGGCGLGPGEDPDSPVSLTVTRDFGARSVLERADAEVAGADTVMRVTQRNAKVSTRFGGDFVHGISGISGGERDGRPVDWFIYVNGILTARGAGGVRVAGGDRIWWDHHDWGLTPDVPAVVGSFPQPFLDASSPQRPVLLECEQPRAGECEAVAERLERADVSARQVPLQERDDGESPRILVGSWAALRDAATEATNIEQGPKSSGVFARFGAGGRSLSVLDPEGNVARRLTGAAGLVAATRRPGGPPVWFVTGTDAAGVAAAVRIFDEPLLRNRFAIATAGGGAPLSVPLTAAGEAAGR